MKMAYFDLTPRLLHEWLSPPIKATFSTLALLTATLLWSLPCQATGFGSAKGEPLIGAPLSLEIEVLNPERDSLECFTIKPIDVEGDLGFFPRHARLDLRKSDDGKTYLVISGDTVQEPVVEFRLLTNCGTQVERRYTLLATPPRELQPAAVTLPALRPSPPAPLPTTSSETSAPQTAPGLTLEQLARQRYPLQPKAREKFKRLIKEANPELSLTDDEALPVAPSALKYPETLPKQRIGPYRPARTKIAPSPSKPPTPAQEKAPAARAKTAASEPPAPAADRLVIAPGTAEKAPPASAEESALAAKAESSFAAQEEMTSRLAQAEQAYKSLQERLLVMENRMRTLEMEKERLQREQEALSHSALVELIISVVVGGALGALVMSFWLRRRAANSAPVIGL